MITTSLFFSAHYYYLRKKGVGENGALMEPQIRTKKSSNEYQIEMSMLTQIYLVCFHFVFVSYVAALFCVGNKEEQGD